MQIMIDLPNENYQVTLTKIMLACRGCSIIELPKGHGDLIDRQELLKSTLCKTFGLRSVDIENAPTIIEADKSESEVQNGKEDM